MSDINFLFSLSLSSSAARDSNNPQDDAEVIRVPQRRPVQDPDFTDFKGVIDTGSTYPFLREEPSSFNLGIFDSFDGEFGCVCVCHMPHATCMCVCAAICV